MLSIKRKLSSKSGASMLLAMVFLMFCLFIGGSVLAAATANGSRVEHLKNDQQDYLSQRSAMLLMSDMLTGTDGKELQVTITDVTMTSTPAEGGEATTKRTVTFTCPTLATGETPSVLQKMLFEIIVGEYKDLASTDLRYSDLVIGNDKTSLDTAKAGAIDIKVTIGSAEETLSTSYDISTSDYSLVIDFGTNSYLSLFMDGSIGESNEKIVTIGDITTTTKTTVIRWGTPVIEKRGA